MTTLTEPVAKRVATLVRKLASDFDGEVLSVVAAMKRVFLAEGLSFHDIATVIESCDGEIAERKYSDADAKVIYERGKAAGRAEQQNGDLEFYHADGAPRWYEIAVFCQRNVERLSRTSDREKEFIADMPGKLLGREPSLAQAKWLLTIFVKLGGQVDAKLQATIFSR